MRSEMKLVLYNLEELDRNLGTRVIVYSRCIQIEYLPIHHLLR